MSIAKLTIERRVALREFQELYGDDWQNVMLEFHYGRPNYRAEHLLHYIRQIRNYITADPCLLPDLREEV